MSSIKCIIVVLFIAVFLSLSAQIEINKRNEQPKVPSWDSYALMQYGKIGTSLYTGTVSYSIPIYTYKDQDFEIPISLDYSTNGYRVNHSSGVLGHGWSLSPSGVITRHVRGIPDDVIVQKTVFMNQPIEFRGYEYLVPSNSYTDYLSYDHDGKVFFYRAKNNLDYYETEPDLYTFNFMSFSGSFERNDNNVLVNGQKFRIYDATGSSQGLKVEISSDGQTFTLTDCYGCKYIFQSNEYYELPCSEGGMPDRQITVSWILSSMIAPNNHTVSLQYDKRIFETNQGQGVERNYQPRLNYYESGNGYITTVHPGTTAEVDSSQTAKARLTCIIFGNGVKMDFNYEVGSGERRILYPNFIRNAHCDNSRLSSIVLSDNGAIIKTCQLNYFTNIPATGPNNSNIVTFLRSVDISGEGTFSFEYNDEIGDYPFLGTTTYDHWGYYNGPGKGFPLGMNQLRNSITYNNYNETIVGDIKEPSFAFAKMGTLRKIAYPTGGYSLIEYEPHDYSTAVTRETSSISGEPQNASIPRLRSYAENQTAGGIRIHQIINHVSDTIASDTVTYLYQKPDEPSLSSGILINAPRYGIQYNTIANGKWVNYYNLSNFLYDYDRTHIEYSDVETHRGSGFSSYHYSTSKEYVDTNYSLATLPLELLTCGYFNEQEPYRIYYPTDSIVGQILTPVPSRQYMRGKLLREAEYNNEGVLVREITNTFSFPLVDVDSIYHVCGEVAKKIYYPRHNFELTSTTTSDYYGCSAISKTEKYEYNRIGLPTVVKTSTSQGDTIVTRNTYVMDTTINDQVFASMVTNHQFGNLLKSEIHRYANSIDKLLSATRLTYYSPNLNNTRLICPFKKEEWLSGNDWKAVEQYNFDDCGNLVEVLDETALSSTYLWSYGNRHIVSSLQNATKNEVETALNALGCQPMDSIAKKSILTAADLGNIKMLGEQLNSSMQTTMRYRPSIGLTENVTPNLSVDSYGYDGYGRLKEIRDALSKIIEQQEYNIITVPSPPPDPPFTASMQCDTLSLNDGIVAASVLAQGGSGYYGFRWHLVNSSNTTIHIGNTNQMSHNLLPGSYSVIFIVTDLVSGDSCTCTWLANVPIRFTNIHHPQTEQKNWTTIIGDLALESPATVAFSLDYDAPYECVVTIDERPINSSGSGQTVIQKDLPTGTTTVSLSMFHAEQGEAMLSITSASGLTIGSPNNLSTYNIE